MLEYAPMLHVSYYAQNYAGIICQGLHLRSLNRVPIRKVSSLQGANSTYLYEVGTW